MPDTEGAVLAAAVRNNAGWCALVCDSHGIPNTFGEAAWRSTRRTPPYYPDAVTLRPDAVPDDVLSGIDTASPACSVKDSFAALDLTADGFVELFTARWIHRAAGDPVPSLRTRRVSTAAALRDWQAAWHADDVPVDVFRPALLDDPSVFVAAAYDGDGLRGGFVLYRGTGVVGLSNLFAVGGGDVAAVWSSAVTAAAVRFPGHPWWVTSAARRWRSPRPPGSPRSVPCASGCVDRDPPRGHARSGPAWKCGGIRAHERPRRRAVAEVLLFHHAQGRTDGILAFADELRRAGHTVHVPDLYDGNVFGSLDEGIGYAEKTGFGEIVERGVRAADDLPEALVYAGFSLGVMPAQRLAQTRPGAVGALLFESCVPASEFGSWPAGLPVQVHGMDADPFFAGEGDIDAARQLVAGTEHGELFVYPGNVHLFADPSLPTYDPDAAALLIRRVLDFLADR